MTGLIINGQPRMPKAFDKRLGFTVAVECRDGKDNAVILAGDRSGLAFVCVEVKPQEKAAATVKRSMSSIVIFRFFIRSHSFQMLISGACALYEREGFI